MNHRQSTVIWRIRSRTNAATVYTLDKMRHEQKARYCGNRLDSRPARIVATASHVKQITAGEVWRNTSGSENVERMKVPENRKGRTWIEKEYEASDRCGEKRR